MKIFRWLRKWYRKLIGGYVHVGDYGAVGDGVTDDTEAVQRAINAASFTNRVYFGVGEYLISQTVDLGIEEVCSNADVPRGGDESTWWRQ